MQLKYVVLVAALGAGGCYVEGDGRVVGPQPVVSGEVVVEAPPAPIQEEIVVRPGYEWIEGRYVRSGGRWVWRKGYYEHERHGYHWVRGHWDRGPHGHYYVEGHWGR
jgi:hypothetical protein